MKKKFSFAIASAALASVLPLTSTLMAYGLRSQEPQTSPSQQTQPGSDADAQMFGGKITKANGKYVLKDSSGKTSYMLDDQKAAKRYEGKVVMVTGTLDQANNVIHVQKIEAAA